jgi:hypothetical protein
MDHHFASGPGQRALTILRANTWGLNFLVLAVLVDIVYRSVVFHEAAWDLFILLGLSGMVTVVFAARHDVRMIGWKSAIVMAVGVVVAAVVSAVLARYNAM